MTRSSTVVVATAAFAVAIFATPQPAKADLTTAAWFLGGVVVGSYFAPAYGYLYGYRAGYGYALPYNGWAHQPEECYWARVKHHGGWRNARICY